MDAGETCTLRFTVREDDTAAALGSGALPVLGTPRLLAWCEAATCAVVDLSLDETSTSVGTRVVLEHVVASPVGAELDVTATVADLDGRKVRLKVIARAVADAADERVVAHGEITRVVVDHDRFLSRLSR